MGPPPFFSSIVKPQQWPWKEEFQVPPPVDPLSPARTSFGTVAVGQIRPPSEVDPQRSFFLFANVSAVTSPPSRTGDPGFFLPRGENPFFLDRFAAAIYLSPPGLAPSAAKAFSKKAGNQCPRDLSRQSGRRPFMDRPQEPPRTLRVEKSSFSAEQRHRLSFEQNFFNVEHSGGSSPLSFFGT